MIIKIRIGHDHQDIIDQSLMNKLLDDRIKHSLDPALPLLAIHLILHMILVEVELLLDYYKDFCIRHNIVKDAIQYHFSFHKPFVVCILAGKSLKNMLWAAAKRWYQLICL